MCKQAVAYHLAMKARQQPQNPVNPSPKTTENNTSSPNSTESISASLKTNVFEQAASNVAGFFRSRTNEWVAFGWTDGSYSGSDNQGSIRNQNQ